MIFRINNQLLEEDDAALGVKDLAIQRGYSIFDFLCFQHNEPLFVDDYLERFSSSAKAMHLQLPYSKTQVEMFLRELIKLNGSDTGGLRLQLTGGYSSDTYTISQPNFIITQHVVNPLTTEQFTKGIKCITHEYVRTLPHVKSTNYLMGVYLQPKLLKQNAQDVIYVKDGSVSELPRANVFVVNDKNEIKTPEQNVLIGITRSRILSLVNKGYNVLTGKVTVDELLNAKEVFLTSSTRNVLPITRINENVIGGGIAGEISHSVNIELLRLQNEYLKTKAGAAYE